MFLYKQETEWPENKLTQLEDESVLQEAVKKKQSFRQLFLSEHCRS